MPTTIEIVREYVLCLSNQFGDDISTIIAKVDSFMETLSYN
jgi:hypothetical protein